MIKYLTTPVLSVNFKIFVIDKYTSILNYGSYWVYERI